MAGADLARRMGPGMPAVGVYEGPASIPMGAPRDLLRNLPGLHKNCLADVAPYQIRAYHMLGICRHRGLCPCESNGEPNDFPQAPRHAGRSTVKCAKGTAFLSSSCDFRLAGNHLLAPAPRATEQGGGVADGPQLLRLPDR